MNILRHISTTIGVLTLTVSTFAQWPTSPDSSVYVGSGSNILLVADGEGGAYIVHGEYYGKCSRIDHQGNFVWSSVSLDGVYSEQHQLDASLTSDSCLLVTYRDIKFIGGFDWGDAHIRVQKISRNGEKLWGNGIAVTPDNASGSLDYHPWLISKVISDGDGGAYVTWNDYRAYRPQERPISIIQRIDERGTPQWDTYGRLVDSLAYGTFLLDQINFTEGLLVYAKINAAGGKETWGSIYNQNGIQLLNEKFEIKPTRISQVNTNGEFFYGDGYGQVIKMDSLFQHVWPEGGITIADTSDLVWSLTPDSSSGVIVHFWRDASSGRFYSQWIDSDGNLKYGPGARFMTQADEFWQTVTMSDTGSFIATYQNYDNQIAQRVDSDGNKLWPEDHIIQNQVDYTVYGPKAVSDGAGGIIYAFALDYTLYIMQVDAAGNIGNLTSLDQRDITQPDTFEISNHYPNPFNNQMAIRLSTNHSGFVNMNVYDLNGRRVFSESRNGRYGINRFNLDFSEHNLSSGAYIVEVYFAQSPTVKRTVKVTYLK